MKNSIKKYIKPILSYILIFAICLTSINLDKLVINAEDINHTHIWASKYDTTNHWEYCTVCGITQNVTAHVYTDHWYLGSESCNAYNYNTKTCSCGYSYIYRKPHNTSTWKTAPADWVHYKHCTSCGAWLTSQGCYKSDGTAITCTNLGTCVVCGYTYTRPNHVLNSAGTCNKCGVHCVDVSNEKTTWSADHTSFTWTVTLKPASGHTVVLPSIVAGQWWNYAVLDITRSSVTNDDGSVTYTNVATFNDNKFNKVGAIWWRSYFTVDGYSIAYMGHGGSGNYWLDIQAPVINPIVQKDQATANGWATIKQLTISGTENLSNIVYISVSDKVTGEKYITDAAVGVVDGEFSYQCTPPIEGDETGRTYVVTVKDEIGNVSTKEFLVVKTDGSAPTLKDGDSLSYTNWTNSAKTVNLHFYDFGSGGMYLSFNNQTSYTPLTKSGEYYTWSKTFSTDQTGTSDYKLYVKDALGNAKAYTLTVGNIDCTAPVITKTDFIKKDNETTVNVTASDSISGISQYAVSKDSSNPTNWQTSNSFKFTEEGTYYVFAKDAVGNVSKPKEINVSINFTGIFKLKATADATANNNLGVVNLDWSKTVGTTNDILTDSTYKAYKSTDNGNTWQTISLMDYTKVTEVKVLQIYPHPNAANQLKTWMETNGYGKGIIKVDSVYIDDFNANPSSYLKDENGNWKYNVLFFGTWDSNNGKDLNTTSYAIVEEYIRSGLGCIFGHDTFVTNYPNLMKLGSKYLDISTASASYNGSLGGNSTVKITKKGLFTTYPWNIGELGTVLTVPLCHNSQQTAVQDIWLRFTLPTYTDADYTNNNNFYLATKNNCAMIQTGHSSGAATDDEQKILANLIFYSYQLSGTAYATDYSGMDTTVPNKPAITYNGYNPSNPNMNVSFSSTDNGSSYKYFVEAYDISTNAKKGESNQESATVTSGIKGYYYIVDNKPTNDFDVKNATFTANTSITVPYSATSGYIHIKAVDKAGNISQVADKQLSNIVTLNPNTGSAITNNKLVVFKNYNFNTNVAGSIPTKTGYDFKGYYTATSGGTQIYNNTGAVSNDGTYFTGGKYNQTTDLNVYAQWTPTNYSITYNLNGGSITGQKASYNIETNTFTLPTPTKTGYTFTGWTGSNGDTPQTSVSIEKGSTGNKTYTANWTVNSYYLDLNGVLDGTSTSHFSNYGTVDVYVDGIHIANDVADFWQPINYGSKWEIKDIKPTKGHLYNGVYSGSLTGTMGVGGAWTYLKFSTKVLQVKFHRNTSASDTTEAEQSFTYGIANQKFTNKGWSRTGYSLAGWAESFSANTIKYSVLSDVSDDWIDSNYPKIDLYAVWTPVNYTITYNLDGGILLNQKTNYNVETESFTLPIPTKNGYEFLGWIGSNGSTPQRTVTIPKGSTGNKTYTAVWDPLPGYTEIYEGKYYEGQIVTYDKLLEIVKAVDLDDLVNMNNTDTVLKDIYNKVLAKEELTEAEKEKLKNAANNIQIEIVKIEYQNGDVETNLNKSNYILDTSSKHIGKFNITYRVKDIVNNKYPDTVNVKTEYTKECKIVYNNYPSITLEPYVVVYDDNVRNDMSKFTQYIKSFIKVSDNEDTLDDEYMWKKTDSYEALQNSVMLTISNISIKYSPEIYTSKNLTALKNIKTLDELYNLKNTNKELFDAIESYNLIVDAKDQFGKYASGTRVSNADKLTLIQNNTLDKTQNATDRMIMVVFNTNDIGVNKTLKQEIRYVSKEYLDSVYSDSYWGSDKYGKQDLINSLDKKDQTDSLSYDEYNGNVKQSNGNKVNIHVKDYTNN